MALLPENDQTACTLQGCSAPYFDCLCPDGDSLTLTPNVTEEETKGRCGESINEHYSDRFFDISGNFSLKKGARDLCMKGWVKAKQDPDDAENKFEGMWFKIEAIPISPLRCDKPAVFNLTLRFKPEWQERMEALSQGEQDEADLDTKE